MTSFAAFSKAGCNPLFACGASAAMMCFPLLLQLRSIRFMAQVSAYQRQKESKVDTEITFRVYLKASRALRLMESGRRICVLFAFVVLVFIANPQEPRAFVLVLPLVLHTDEKLAKLWKALADTESAWVFLHTQYPLPDQGAHQEITYNSISHPKPASEVLEARERMQVSSEASWAAQVLRIWKEGYEYKSEMTETTTGLRLSRKRLGDDANEV
ncbi:hypothetical protein F5883DRAFT_559785 [Diaporthe sp. PMI_573]|nr:hypothetical protein F5883DRAFT_559785 [Diaporthaceae sp. PMI_573]